MSISMIFISQYVCSLVTLILLLQCDTNNQTFKPSVLNVTRYDWFSLVCENRKTKPGLKYDTVATEHHPVAAVRRPTAALTSVTLAILTTIPLQNSSVDLLVTDVPCHVDLFVYAYPGFFPCSQRQSCLQQIIAWTICWGRLLVGIQLRQRQVTGPSRLWQPVVRKFIHTSVSFRVKSLKY